MTTYSNNGHHFVLLFFILEYYTVNVVKILSFSTEMDAKDFKCLFACK